MIHHDVEPRSMEWRKLRLGIPTASEFDKIMMPAKMRRSAQWDRYQHRLLGEWLSGEVDLEETFENRHIQRGILNEDKAVAAYECLTELETTRGGFWTLDSGDAGASPDRLVGSEGILEIKNPGLTEQVNCAFHGVELNHVAQIQGQMWITERKWVDVFSYHELLTLPPKRISRDEEYIEQLSQLVREFIEEMLRRRKDLERDHGPFLRGGAMVPAHRDELISQEDLDAILRTRNG